MISLTEVVRIIFYLIVAALVFGVLWWVIGAVAKQAAPEGGESSMFVRYARIVLVVLGAMVLIGILLSMVGGVPIVRM